MCTKMCKDRLEFEEQKCAISKEFDDIDAFMVNKNDYIYFQVKMCLRLKWRNQRGRRRREKMEEELVPFKFGIHIRNDYLD